jgi:hypothetical protein
MLSTRNVPDRVPVVSGEAIDFWRQMKSHRWARTSLHRVVASSTTVSMSDAVVSFTTGQWSANSAEVRWKRFLLRASHRIAQSGSEGAPRLALTPPR